MQHGRDLRGNDSTDSTDSHDISTGHGAHTWSRSIVDRPGQEARPARERPHRDEVDAHVADVGVGLPAQDGKANNSQHREGGEVRAPLAGLVARIGDGNSDDTRTHVRRDAVQLGLCVRPVEVAQDGGQEHRQALDGDVDEEEAQAAGVVVDVCHGAFDVGQGDFFVGVGAVFTDQPLGGDHLLALGEELARRGGTRKPDGRDEPDDHGDYPLEEEDVAPRVDPHGCDAPVRDARQARRQEAAEGARHARRGDVDADAEEELLALVEGAEVECEPGHGAALEGAEDCPGHEEARVAPDEGGAERHEAEADDQEGEVEPRADALEEDVARDLDGEVDDVEDGQRPVEPEPLEPEVLLHALDPGVADVDAVEEAQQVQDGDPRHRAPVHLVPQDRLLLFCPLQAIAQLRLGLGRALRRIVLDCESGQQISSSSKIHSRLHHTCDCFLHLEKHKRNPNVCN